MELQPLFRCFFTRIIQKEAVAPSNVNFSPDIYREICLSFMCANISPHMSGSKITIEEIRVHLWTIFYTFLSICLQSWPGKYIRFYFFSFLFTYIVCISLKDCMVGFWRNSYQQTYRFFLIPRSTVGMHFSILGVFSKKNQEKADKMKVQLFLNIFKVGYVLSKCIVSKWHPLENSLSDFKI